VSIWDDIAQVPATIVNAAGDVVHGVANAAAGVFEGSRGLVGVVTAGASLFIAGPGALIPAFVAGAAAGQFLVRHRLMTVEEYAFAQEVYVDSLPPGDRIVLTNLFGLGGKKFTCPNAAGQVLLNLGEGYDHPTTHVEPAYPAPGKLFIHELAHAWQIHHSSFVPGLVCEGIYTQLAREVYEPGPAGKPWSQFNLEQQATIVDEWFAPSGRGPDPYRMYSGFRPDHPFYRYIRDNIGGPRWQILDNNPATTQIVSDEEALYQLHNTGLVWKYTGTPLTGWLEVDNNPATNLRQRDKGTFISASWKRPDLGVH
jgi:hypothetical protein